MSFLAGRIILGKKTYHIYKSSTYTHSSFPCIYNNALALLSFWLFAGPCPFSALHTPHFILATVTVGVSLFVHYFMVMGFSLFYFFVPCGYIPICHDGMPWFDPIFFSLYRRLIIFSITAYCVSSVNTFKAYHIIVRPLCKKHQKLVWLSQHTIYKYNKPVNSFRSLCCVIECWIMPESVMSFCLSSCLLTDLTCHEWSLGT